jgi:hypothetical protein
VILHFAHLETAALFKRAAVDNRLRVTQLLQMTSSLAVVEMMRERR